MLHKGQRVRFSAKAIAEINKTEDGRPIPNPVPLPDPSEVFTIREIVPWYRKSENGGREPVYDDNAWANLGPSHQAVALKLLEPA